MTQRTVKALKEVVVLRTVFNPTRSTSPCYKPTHAHNIHNTYKNESKHSEMGPVRQSPIQTDLVKGSANTDVLYIISQLLYYLR